MQFISVIKAVFSALLLQSSVSHDPSEIILIKRFAAQKHLLLSMLKTVVLLNIFVETMSVCNTFVCLRSEKVENNLVNLNYQCF